ncbi:MAG: LemA family protein [bacterium]
MNKTLVGIIVAGVVAVLAAISMRNTVVALHENGLAKWAQVETVLQRRYDLIPNLVNTVKGYASHEKGLFEEVARLRSQWAAAKTQTDKAAAAGQLEAGLGRLLLVAEQYPQLKASENFMGLQTELAGTENRISVERQRYNEAVRAFNTKIKLFPWNVFAARCGFNTDMKYFESVQQAKEAPKVEF